MAVIPASILRSSDALRWELLTETLNQRSLEMVRLQRQLSSGQRLITASQDPTAGRLVLALQRSLEETEQQMINVQRGRLLLQGAESALGDVGDLLREAESLGQQEISLPSDERTREAAGQVVSSIIDGVLAIANRNSGGRYLFSGLSDEVAPFEMIGGGILFRGDEGRATTTGAGGQRRAISISGADAFGALDGVVEGFVDLDPVIAPMTRLEWLNGGTGVQTGSIIVSDGTNSTTIDLSRARDINDVIVMMEAVLPPTTSVTIDTAANALEVTSTLPGADIEIRDVLGGATARDLGLVTPVGGSGTGTFVGADLDPVITPLTRLSDLAASGTIDFASGLVISNGPYSATVDISTAQTFEDLINAINSSGTHVQARIAPEGDHLQVVSLLSGSHLSIGENGGTTASDLGLRTLDGSMSLLDLNRGDGVGIAEGSPDLSITFSDGTSASVDLTGSQTVQDVLDRINAAAPGSIQAQLVSVGNGIELQDLTGGAGTFSVANASGSAAAEDLGLWQNAPGPGAVITGTNVNPMVAENLLTHLQELREALLTDDTAAITRATARLAGDSSSVVTVRGGLGVDLNELRADELWIEDQRLADQALLSMTRDLDYAVAMAEFAATEVLMEAALRTAASVGRMSLLDYL